MSAWRSDQTPVSCCQLPDDMSWAWSQDWKVLLERCPVCMQLTEEREWISRDSAINDMLTCHENRTRIGLRDFACGNNQKQKVLKQNARSGNRTLVIRVTGGYTNHYTNPALVSNGNKGHKTIYVASECYLTGIHSHYTKMGLRWKSVQMWHTNGVAKESVEITSHRIYEQQSGKISSQHLIGTFSCVQAIYTSWTFYVRIETIIDFYQGVICFVDCNRWSAWHEIQTQKSSRNFESWALRVTRPLQLV